MRDFRASRLDVVWSYLSAITSMTSGILLLPALLAFLTAEELGLWYVYVAISALTSLMEFGFSPTFSRNIVYILSGAQKLSAQGREGSADAEKVNWHLLRNVVSSSRLVYAGISGVAVMLMAGLGTWYVASLTANLQPETVWGSWIVFCVATFVNLYFLHYTTLLRGLGDVAATNSASTYSKLTQLIVSVFLLWAGYGLVGAAVGFLCGGVTLRVFSVWKLRGHSDVVAHLSGAQGSVSWGEIRNVLRVVGPLAWRDGVIQLSLFVSSQGTSIMCSLYLSLSETGVYSLLLQIANAVCTLSASYARAHFPVFQSLVVRNQRGKARELVGEIIALYWVLFVFGSACVMLVGVPLLSEFKSSMSDSSILFLLVAGYTGLYYHHSLVCGLIASRNEIPYMGAYLAAALIGVGLTYLVLGVWDLGVAWMVVAQFSAQMIYNNWRWPHYLAAAYDSSYLRVVRGGMVVVAHKVFRLIGRLR